MSSSGLGAPRAAAPRSLTALLLAALLLVGCDDPVDPADRGFEHFEVIGPGYFPELNDAGEIAFNRRGSDGVLRPMLYRDGEVAPLPIRGDSGWVMDINERGDVLGYDPMPIVWKADGTIVEPETEHVDVKVGDLNDEGVFVGGVRAEGAYTYTPVRWAEDGTAEELPLPALGVGAFSSRPNSPGHRVPIGLNDRGDIVAENELLRADGTNVVFGVVAAGLPELFAITESRDMLGLFFRAAPSPVYGLFGESTELKQEFSRFIPSINESGDVAHTKFFAAIPERRHFFHRDAAGTGLETFRLDTFPEFEEQEPNQLEITDVNDAGVVALHGFRPRANSPGHVALYRHPAFSR